MTLLCDDADVMDRLGRPLTLAESQQVWALIAEASVSATAYLGRSWPTFEDVPEACRTTVSRMVARVFSANSAGAQVSPGLASYSASMGPFSSSTKFGPEAIITDSRS